MKIFIFGSTGMVGSYVASYFEKKKYNVIRVTRDDMNAENITNTELDIYFELHGDLMPNDVVINCIGFIKQKMTDNDSVKAIKINSIFPYLLSSICSINYAKLIHISTDGVFSGLEGGYRESDEPHPVDLYGATKLSGEPGNCMIIRTSMIGESEFNGSLLEWVRNNKVINGYTNHSWNGVTCLQFAKYIEEIISGNLFWYGVRHYYSEEITKAGLVRMIAEVYKTDSVITDIKAKNPINRILASDYIFKEPPALLEQIKEQYEYHIKIIL